jgi:hypothetical protein
LRSRRACDTFRMPGQRVRAALLVAGFAGCHLGLIQSRPLPPVVKHFDEVIGVQSKKRTSADNDDGGTPAPRPSARLSLTPEQVTFCSYSRRRTLSARGVEVGVVDVLPGLLQVALRPCWNK